MSFFSNLFEKIGRLFGHKAQEAPKAPETQPVVTVGTVVTVEHPEPTQVIGAQEESPATTVLEATTEKPVVTEQAPVTAEAAPVKTETSSSAPVFIQAEPVVRPQVDRIVPREKEVQFIVAISILDQATIQAIAGEHWQNVVNAYTAQGTSEYYHPEEHTAQLLSGYQPDRVIIGVGGLTQQEFNALPAETKAKIAAFAGCPVA